MIKREGVMLWCFEDLAHLRWEWNIADLFWFLYADCDIFVTWTATATATAMGTATSTPTQRLRRRGDPPELKLKPDDALCTHNQSLALDHILSAVFLSLHQQQIIKKRQKKSQSQFVWSPFIIDHSHIHTRAHTHYNIVDISLIYMFVCWVNLAFVMLL